MVKCEEIREGDVLVSVRSNDCCVTIGKEYVVQSENGQLFVRPDCFNRLGDRHWLFDLKENSWFELRKSGPW